MSALLGPSTRRVVGNSVRRNARGYAVGRPEESTDPKKEIIRRSLYPSNLRNTPSPTGGWRHDAVRALQYAIPSVEAHETIDRAFLLHRRHVRKAREAELERKFNCMNQAMEELAELEPHLYFEANKKEDLRERTPAEQAVGSKMKLTEQRALDARIRGLFPREMRVPTDTPSKNGWNYNWNPFPRPL